MVIRFYAGVIASTTHTWKTLSGSSAEDVHVMTKKSIDGLGRPLVMILSATKRCNIDKPKR